MSNRLLEHYLPVVKMDGIQTYKTMTVNSPATLTVNGQYILNFSPSVKGYTLGASVLALATTTPLTIPSTNAVMSLTPTQSQTLNFPVPPVNNLNLYFVITTSGTSSFTITFGTNSKNQGTLATGTVSAKVFVVEFVSDGTFWNEVARTSAM